MPKYLMLIAEEESAYANASEADMGAVMQMHADFTREVADAGATILGGEALLPSATATYLRGTRTEGVVAVDNPAPDLKELLGAYYLVEAADEKAARAIAERCPAPHGYIEVRPIWEFNAT